MTSTTSWSPAPASAYSPIRWDGKAFTFSSYPFPYFADGITSGDLFGRGLTELAVFAYDTAAVDSASWLYNVCIVEFRAAGPEVVWNDRGRLATGR